jgi:hypothetical protein
MLRVAVDNLQGRAIHKGPFNFSAKGGGAGAIVEGQLPQHLEKDILPACKAHGEELAVPATAACRKQARGMVWVTRSIALAGVHLQGCGKE